MAAHRIDIRDAIRSSDDIIRLARQRAEQRWGRADIPQPVEVGPQPGPRTALLLVPFVGLLIGIHLWRQIQKTRRRL